MWFDDEQVCFAVEAIQWTTLRVFINNGKPYLYLDPQETTEDGDVMRAFGRKPTHKKWWTTFSIDNSGISFETHDYTQRPVPQRYDFVGFRERVTAPIQTTRTKSESATTYSANRTRPQSQEVDDNKIYTTVDESPKFPNGEAELLSYVRQSIIYPPKAIENNIQGTVVVQFVVKKDGSIGEIKVARGKSPELDEEAIRIVNTFTQFIPGKKNGQKINSWYTLPIRFKLPD